MLAAIIIWVYLTFIFLIYGVGTIALIRWLLRVQTITPVPPAAPVLLGLVVSAWLSSALSLVMKTGLLAHLLVLTGALLILLFQYREIKNWFQSAFHRRYWIVWLLMLLASFTTLLYAVKIPSNPDTPLYHAQAIHWIEAYPAIPGLGNLEPRLGANSDWFTLNALFSFSFLGVRSLHLVPAFLFLVSLLYFLSGFQNLLGGDFRLSQIVKVAFVPLAFYVLIDEVSSPGTDLPVLLFYWVILCLWLESVEKDESSQFLQFVIFFFSVFVITFKLSGIPILLIALQILVRLLVRKKYSLFFAYTGIAVLALLPWIIRTFILTGYWLYPDLAFQFLSPHVDWRIPIDRVLSFKQGVQAWALSPRSSWDEVSGFSWMQRFRFWFSNLTVNQRGTFILALFSPLVFGVLSKQNKKHTAYTLIVLAAFVSFLFWLFIAPNFRFGYGFVLGIIVLALAPMMFFVLDHFANYRFYLLAALALVLLIQQVHVILGSMQDGTHYANSLILPADYVHVPTDACSLHGISISCARSYRQCGYDAFPCVPKIPKNVELRGDTFLEGFHNTTIEP